MPEARSGAAAMMGPARQGRASPKEQGRPQGLPGSPSRQPWRVAQAGTPSASTCAAELLALRFRT